MVQSTTFWPTLEDGRSATLGCEYEEAAQGARLVAGGACGRGWLGQDLHQRDRAEGEKPYRDRGRQGSGRIELSAGRLAGLILQVPFPPVHIRWLVLRVPKGRVFAKPTRCGSSPGIAMGLSDASLSKSTRSMLTFWLSKRAKIQRNYRPNIGHGQVLTLRSTCLLRLVPGRWWTRCTGKRQSKHR